MLPSETTLVFHDLLGQGPVSYDEGLRLQHAWHAERAHGGTVDRIMFLEHRPVISMGRRGEEGDVLAGNAELARLGVDVARSERGGQVTFHGPGQLVVYFVVGLGTRLRQVRSFVEGIEHAVIGYLADEYGLVAHLEPEHPGIWLEQGKVAAVGVSLKERVSMHGLALNLDVDPAWFSMIVPCGIRNRPAVSIAQCGVAPQTAHEAARSLAPRLAKALNYESWLWR